jgi:hypothetical protein
MAKAILEFDLNEPDDVMAFKRANKSLDMALMIFEIQNNLRKKCLRIAEGQEADSDITDGIYIVMEQLRELAEDLRIDTDELIN